MAASSVAPFCSSKTSERSRLSTSALSRLTRRAGDKDHAVLECDGFELVVHQIPKHIAETIVITQSAGKASVGRDTTRLSRVERRRQLVASRARSAATSTTRRRRGPIADANFFFGYDPEGNQFGVSQRPRSRSRAGGSRPSVGAAELGAVGCATHRQRRAASVTLASRCGLPVTSNSSPTRRVCAVTPRSRSALRAAPTRRSSALAVRSRRVTLSTTALCGLRNSTRVTVPLMYVERLTSYSADHE